VVASFTAATVGVYVFADHQFAQIIDRSQRAAFSEKISSILHSLAETERRLHFTGMPEAYEKGFQEFFLERFRQEYFDEASASHPFLMKRDGTCLAHPRCSPEQFFSEQSFLASLLTQRAGEFEHTQNGRRYWTLFETFEPWDWIVGYSIPTDVKYADVLAFRAALVSIMVGFMTAAALFVALVAGRFVRPVKKLTETAEKIAAGDLDTPMDISARGEVGMLAKSFAKMRDGLAEKMDDLSRKNFALEREMEQRREIQSALSESEERYRATFDQAPVGIASYKLDGRYFRVNRHLCKILGYTQEELLKTDVWQITHPLDLDISRDCVRRLYSGQSQVCFMEKRYLKKDGHIVWANVTISVLKDEQDKPKNLIAVVEDITERRRAAKEKKRLEERLQEAQKLEALGTLAGGIAHDFNNLLMSIQGNISLLLLSPQTPEPVKNRLKNIETHIQDATGLTRQLLGLAQGGKFSVDATNVNQLVQKTAAMFGRTRKEISLHLDLAAQSLAQVDRGQVEQVLLNLLVNAWQAMPGGGQIFISCKDTILNSSFANPLDCAPGHYVEIKVADTGCGMDSSTLKKIFDPFFTTKDKARGTGLGLSSANGIVKNHGGCISVESQPGKGSTFRVFLPASPESGPVKDAQPLGNMPGEIVEYGTETILLVDDEKDVRETVRDLLTGLGYTVLEAQTPEKALGLYIQNMNAIALVILDMVMPKMSGVEVFDKIRQANPKAKVLLFSGYSLNEQAERIMQRGCNGFIQKPVNLVQLSTKIREVLKASD
jgi:PAS domain S-box-containing protein